MKCEANEREILQRNSSLIISVSFESSVTNPRQSFHTLIGMAVLFNMVRQSITESLREFFITVKIFNAINPVLERLRVRPVNAFPNQDLGLADVNAQPASYRGHRRRNRHRRIHSNTFQITLSQTL